MYEVILYLSFISPGIILSRSFHVTIFSRSFHVVTNAKIKEQIGGCWRDGGGGGEMGEGDQGVQTSSYKSVRGL